MEYRRHGSKRRRRTATAANQCVVRRAALAEYMFSGNKMNGCVARRSNALAKINFVEKCHLKSWQMITSREV